MQKKRFELAALEVIECAKPWREADADISEAIDYCKYYGKEMIRISENPRTRDIPGEMNQYFYAPRGVAAVISPWNFPAGDSRGSGRGGGRHRQYGRVQAASAAAAVGAKLAELFAEAGLPAGVVNYLPGPGKMVGAHLVKHPGVQTIAFTGSREVGSDINRVAGEVVAGRPALKRVIAELGGKNAIIVDSDADLTRASRRSCRVRLGMRGRSARRSRA